MKKEGWRPYSGFPRQAEETPRVERSTGVYRWCVVRS
nr:MAG TPA: hypothetical protein [Caudoviricetes sp.]